MPISNGSSRLSTGSYIFHHKITNFNFKLKQIAVFTINFSTEIFAGLHEYLTHKTLINFILAQDTAQIQKNIHAINRLRLEIAMLESFSHPRIYFYIVPLRGSTSNCAFTDSLKINFY